MLTTNSLAGTEAPVGFRNKVIKSFLDLQVEKKKKKKKKEKKKNEYIYFGG